MADLGAVGNKLSRLIADSAALGVRFEGKIGERTFRLKPGADWPASALRDFRQGDLASFAEKCLISEDVGRWVELDPTLSQALEFIANFEEVTGEDVGESVAS